MAIGKVCKRPQWFGQSASPVANGIQESPPVGQQQQQFFTPKKTVIESESCGCGSEVAVEDCGCNQSQHANTPSTPTHESFYGISQYSVQGAPQRVAQTEQAPVVQDNPPLEPIPETEWAPVVEPKKQEMNVEQGELKVIPELLEAPQSEAIPYVEPNFNTSATSQIDEAKVTELDNDNGFLAPQSLIDSAGEVVEESIEDPQENIDDADDFESVLEPTEAELAKKNILKPAVDVGPVVLKARPVMNHKVNNQSVIQRSDAVATNRIDSYGLPVDSSVQFSELPPMDAGTRPRPVSFQRDEATTPPAKHVEEADINDKTTRLENKGMQVVESTTNVPTDVEPMLRMTAIPYAGSSSLGAAIARIKVGKTPLIVRGAYPRDVEYERLARERNEQATRSVIIPSTSLKTIDR